LGVFGHEYANKNFSIKLFLGKGHFLGVSHKINGDNQQKYLDEYVYKISIRYFKLIFERLVVASFYPY
jgi:hypothetical protein